jgi:PTH1 family peptidyl-tRNA hydrolase
MSLTLVAALGNPGKSYANTRHNLGWIVLEHLAKKHGLSWQKELAFDALVARWNHPKGVRWLVKPQTFMNESGRSVGAIARFHKLTPELVTVVYDDITIELGRIKVTVTGSAGGHNGIISLLEHVGDGFARFRLGIGPKEPKEMDMKDFVLSSFSSDQLSLIDKTLDQTVQSLELLLNDGAPLAMNHINRKADS